MKTSRTALAVALGTAMVPASVMANDDITVSVTVPVEVQYENTYKTTDNSGGSDLFTTIEPEIVVGLPHGFSLQAGLTLEPLRDRNPREDRAFKSHGAYIGTLQLVWEHDAVMLHAGKFTPTFAFSEGRGLYGDTFQGDYELTERLGFGGAVTVPVENVADVTVAASLFTRDRTSLSDAAITSRERLQYSDGTPGNTKGLNNGTIAVDIVPAAVPDLLVRASYMRQGKGQGDTADQSAWGLGATYGIEVAEDVVVSPMIDWVRGSDADGFTDATSTPGATTNHLTAGVAVAVGPWFGTLAHGVRTYKDPVTPTQRDRFTQVSAGYEFDFGLGLEAGWMRLHEGGDKYSTVGLLAAYTLEF